MTESKSFGTFKLKEIAQSFPPASDSLLLDVYLTDEPSASTRVFRVYRSTPPHFHAGSDEHLYVLSGAGTSGWMTLATPLYSAPATWFSLNVESSMPCPNCIRNPVVFLAIDTPRRDPTDILFVNPEDGTPESFIRPFAN